MQKNIQDKIKQELEKIRPHLQADGGDVEFVNFDEKTGKLEVRLQGACLGCPMAQMTLEQGIGKTLQKEIPEAKEVVNVA